MLNPQQKRRAVKLLSHSTTVLLMMLGYGLMTELYLVISHTSLSIIEQFSPHLMRLLTYAVLALSALDFYVTHESVPPHLGEFARLSLFNTLPIVYAFNELQTGSSLAFAATVMMIGMVLSNQVRIEWNAYHPGYYRNILPEIFLGLAYRKFQMPLELILSKMMGAQLDEALALILIKKSGSSELYEKARRDPQVRARLIAETKKNFPEMLEAVQSLTDPDRGAETHEQAPHARQRRQAAQPTAPFGTVPPPHPGQRPAGAAASGNQPHP